MEEWKAACRVNVHTIDSLTRAGLVEVRRATRFRDQYDGDRWKTYHPTEN